MAHQRAPNKRVTVKANAGLFYNYEGSRNQQHRAAVNFKLPVLAPPRPVPCDMRKNLLRMGCALPWSAAPAEAAESRLRSSSNYA